MGRTYEGHSGGGVYAKPRETLRSVNGMYEALQLTISTYPRNSLVRRFANCGETPSR